MESLHGRATSLSWGSSLRVPAWSGGGIGAIPVSTTVSLTSLTCRDAPSLDKRHCSLVSGIRMTCTTPWTKNRICCSLLSPGKPANARGRKQSVHRANGGGGQKINRSDLATLEVE